MPDYSPTEVARELNVAGETLRKWAREFAPLLSPSARARRRRYTDADVAVLRHTGMLLNTGMTYAEVRAALSEGVVSPPPPPSVEASPITDAVVIQPDDQARAADALLAEYRAHIDRLRQHTEAQQVLIAQLQQQADQQRERAEGDRASLLAQLKQQRDQADQDRADLVLALERARDDEARALEALRATLGKVPRWLRALLGLGA